MENKEKKLNKGFTLVELLVTILVLAVVASFVGGSVLIALNKSEKKAQEISINNIKSSALNYTKEFKTTDEEWYKTKEPGKNYEFACTTVQQLINKGFLKSESLDEATRRRTIKIIRNEFKSIDNAFLDDEQIVECDKTKPGINLMVDGLKKNDWFYDKTNTFIKIEGIQKGLSKIKEVSDITINDVSYKNREINSNGFFKLSFKNLPNEISGDSVKICASVVNTNGIFSDNACLNVKIDFSVPTKPIINPSDNIETNNWHKDNFSLQLSNTSTSPSGNYFMYRIKNTDNYNKVSGNEINNLINNEKYDVISCNNVDKCSTEFDEYFVKIDNKAPQIISFEPSTSNTAKSLDIIATFVDNESGIVKYKINKNSNYTNDNWTSVPVTNSKITYNINIKENGDYYVWVEDAMGNHSSNILSIDNIDNEAPIHTSGGVLKKGSLTKAIFIDKSEPISIKYIIKEKQKTPKYSDFKSSNTSYKVKCDHHYYAYALAEDRLGNYKIIYLDDYNANSCPRPSRPSGGGGGSSHSSGGGGSSCDAKCQMEKNSAAWHDCTSQSCRDDLHQKNQDLANNNYPDKSYDADKGKWQNSDGSNFY